MEKKIYGVIYGLIDGTNDFEYIGQTIRSVEKRFKEHAKDPYYIGSAIRAHGEDMFVIAILKVCYSKAELDFWERHFIKSRDTMVPNGYNLTEGGESSSFCEEARAKMSAARTGEKNHFFGKHHAAESMAKASALRRGQTPYKNLIAEMDAHNLSYTALAKLLSISRKTFSDKMTTKQNFTAEQIAKLVEIFNKPADYLMVRDDGLPATKSKEETSLKMSMARRSDTHYKNLLCEMNKRNLSYNRLVKLLGLKRKAVSEKMRDGYSFSTKNIEKLVEIFGLPADYLMFRDDGLPATKSKEETSLKMSMAQRSDTHYKNLLCEMDKRNLSYGELAKLLGLCHQSVSLKIRDERKFTTAQVAKLVEIFGKPADYLMSRDDGLPATTSKAETSLKISMARRSDTHYKNLLCEMDKRNLSYNRLAKLLGLEHESVSAKMRGRQNFTAAQVAKLVEIFGKPADYLLMT